MITTNNRLTHFYISQLFICTLLTACATVSPPPASGFLENYDNLSVDPNDESLLWWEVNDFDWRNYDKVMIDPMKIMFHPESEAKLIQSEKLAELTDTFKSAITKELGDNYQLTSQAGSGVLQIQAAITDVKTSNATLNMTTALVAFVPVDMGGASIEVRFLDSETGRLVATGMDQKLGVPTQIRAGFTELGHAKEAAKEWAKELHTALKTNP